MKILIYAPTSTGGHPEYVAKLFSPIADRPNHEVSWYCESSNPAPRYRSENINVVENPVTMVGRSEGLAKWMFSRLSWKRRHDTSFLRWFRSADVVFDSFVIEEIQRFTLPFLVRAGRKRGLKSVVVHLHNSRRHDYRGSLIDRVDEWTVGIGLRAADKVVCHDEASAETIQRRYRVLPSRVKIIPHGLQRRVSHQVARSYSKAGVIRVLFFGVNRPNKGLGQLVDAIGRDLSFRLTIAGVTDADYLSTTENLLRDCPGVEWLNRRIEDDELSELFGRTDVVALPYVSFEAQSGVLHLALEYGVPVVATDVGGMREVIDAFEVGEVVPVNDTVALASALRTVGAQGVRVQAIERILDERSWSEVGDKLLRVLISPWRS